MFTGLSEVFGLIVWDKTWRTWSFGLGATVATARLLTFLGDASYSIYLVHLPAMSMLAIVLRKIGGPWGLPPDLVMIILIALASAIGSAVYVLIEKPLLARLSSPHRMDATSAK